ncbi:MAG: His/Gly/Thr/Pro-type tRNA ligase C-terminal domain-containing protein, partial [Bacillota bacterium]
GGGRYDGLVQEVGGPSTPGIGFALGVERIIHALRAQQITMPESIGLDLFVAAMGQTAADKAVELLSLLRRHEIACDKDYLGRSLKAQMKYADKVKARYVAILGDDELTKQIVVLRDMQTKEQSEVPMDSLASELKARLKMGQGGNQGC